MKIFISYRRTDSADVTGRIYDRIKDKFGGNVVFKDVDSIPFGVDFRKYIDEAVQGSDVMLVVIGNFWLDIQDVNGRRRLDDPNDFVRLEIEAALRRNIPVIPLFVQNVTGINEHELPESLQSLAYRNGTRIRHDPDFHKDMDRLLRGMQGESEPQPVEKAAKVSPTTTTQEKIRPRAMSHKEKVKFMMADFEKRGLKKDSFAPLPYRILWFLGYEVTPPYFQSTLSMFTLNAFVIFAFFYLFFFGSSLLFGGLDYDSLTWFIILSGMGGLIGGSSAAFEYRKQAKKMNLPGWQDYPKI